MTDQQPQRQAALETKYRVLGEQLSAAVEANIEVRAQNLEMQSEIAMLNSMMGQMGAENRVLRKRLEIGETEPIELADDEEELAGTYAVEIPEPPSEFAGLATVASQEDAAHHHA